MKSKKRLKTLEEKVFETRHQAFRAAKRDNNVPMSQQPSEVVKPGTEEWKSRNLDHRNRRLYIFEILASLFGLNPRKEIHIREDKKAFYAEGGPGDQMDHFNSGEGDARGKLPKHHYYKKK